MRLEEAYSHCLETVRRDDRDRYLLCVLAPIRYRPALMAIHAFNVAISHIPETVSEPILGQIRLQWWRDAIAAIYVNGTPPPHPVIDALRDVIPRHRLSRKSFERILDARERDLEDWRPATIQDLESYARDTAGEILALSMVVLGETDEQALTMGRSAGAAFAMVGILRSLAFQAHRRRFLIPQELVDREGISLRDVFAFKQPNPALNLSVAAIANRAEILIAGVIKQVGQVSLPARILLLEARIAAYHLKRLQAASFNPFDPGVGQRSDGLLLWRLAGRKWFGRY